jgi:hypothetical protein
MSKAVLLWILGVLTVSLLIGGGVWLLFWAFAKAKKLKII